MRKSLFIILAIGFASCQNERGSDKTLGSAKQGSEDTAFHYDSVKVYGKHPVSSDQRVTDTAKAVITFPLFKDSLINTYIQRKTLSTAGEEKHYQSYMEYATGFMDDFDTFQRENKERIQTWFLNINTKVLVCKPGYLSMEMDYISFQGGAHPNSLFVFLNYDPKTGSEIRLDSLILPGSRPTLKRIAENIFRKNEQLSSSSGLAEGYFFKDNQFDINDNFRISDEGLVFLYNPYEIKAYAFGTTELVIPFADLNKVARPNSLLSPIN